MKFSLRTVFMIVFFLLIYAAITYYIGWNTFVYLEALEIRVIPGLFWPLLGILAFAYIIGRSPLWQGRVTRLLKVIGSYYFAILEFALILLPLANLAVWLLRLSGMDGTRAVLLTGTTVVVLLLVLMSWGSRNAWSPVVRTYHVKVDKQVAGRRELRVAVASDIHLGNIVGNRYLGKMVERMNALKPDLVLLAGDVIDDDIEPFIRNGMSRVLRELKAKHGIYAVLGNHEYYGGHIEAYRREMDAIGIRVLLDETVLVDDAFYVAGRKDKTAEGRGQGGRLATRDLLKPLDADKPILLMDHQPYEFGLAAEAGADVLLCGHTHRGQFAPNHWVTGRLFELDWGYMLKEKLHVVVSSGYGTWGPPIRLASRSEIIELVLHFPE